MLNNHKISVVIPAFNEERSIGLVIDDLPKNSIDEIIVVDNASTDHTAQEALMHGAKVLHEPRPGYGAACLKGLSAIHDADVVVILDGDRSDYPEQVTRLLEPIVADEADFVIGSRVLGKRETGSLSPQQYFGNKLAGFLIRVLFGHHFSDMGPFRALRFSSLKSLNMVDKNFGWNVEMQIKAIRKGLRIKEVPVDYRRRIGHSKISGTVSGTIKAGVKIIGTIFYYAFVDKT